METLPKTARRFRLNVELQIPFDVRRVMEVDFLCADSRLVIELDGAQHLALRTAWDVHEKHEKHETAVCRSNAYGTLEAAPQSATLPAPAAP